MHNTDGVVMDDMNFRLSMNELMVTSEVIERQILSCEEFDTKATLLYDIISGDIDRLRQAIARAGNDESNPYLNSMFMFIDDDTSFLSEILGFKERVKAYKDFLAFLTKIEDTNMLFYLFMGVKESTESICKDFLEMEEGHNIIINNRNFAIKTMFEKLVKNV